VAASVVSVVGWLILAKAAMGIVTGWGLLQREEWRAWWRWCLDSCSVERADWHGAGIYTLWVLLPSQSEEEYRTLAHAA